MDGIIYILTNAAMPGYVKVGRTDNIERRLRDLDWTNLPLPFECFYAAKVTDPVRVEALLHDAFGDHRVRARREFFHISPERVVAALRLAAIEDVTPSDEPPVSEEARQDLKEARDRRAKFNFDMVAIPIGAELTFSRDPSITAIVTDARHVTFNGAVTSLSEAARLALAQTGLNWAAAQGPAFWQFQGETLDELRRRVQEEAET